MNFSTQTKQALQEILKYGHLSQAQKPVLYQALVSNVASVNDYLSVIDFRLQIDGVRGLAFLIVYQNQESDNDAMPMLDGWAHPLVRRQRLTLQQSLVLAILRQRLMELEQQYGIGYADTYMSLDELNKQFFIYHKSSGSESQDNERVTILVRQLAEHGLVAIDQNQLLISPLIVHLLNPENLIELLKQYQSVSESAKTESDDESCI